MSKRSRNGDVIVARANTPFQNPLKRRLEWLDAPRKRQMLLQEVRALEEPSRKREAEFDLEICRMNKRLRASIPTAEEAISFLLPHMTRLRRVYLEAKQENEVLKGHLNTLKNAYLVSKTEKKQLVQHASECKDEIMSLRRQLELAKYRLAMTDASCKATLLQ